ncbi:MAG TPA: potassium/proton antiporter [Flavisolibacter sp.]|jgi:cell volume regulation protein A|nr:potassium/proton antiporter [Flavisolibacter sp.]
MTATSGNILLIGSVLLLISILAGKTSSRVGVPTLILFLVIGILAGSEGVGGIHFNNAYTAQFVGITALNFILFSGGLDTDWRSIKPILWRGIALSTIGVFITAFVVGMFAYFILDFSVLEGLLLGSIVSSTDAAAVFSILRNKGVGLKGSLRPVLELESGSNDPMAYFLTIAFTGLVANAEMNIWELFPMLIRQFLIGAAFGIGMGKASQLIANRINLDYDGLYPVLFIGLAFFTYSITDLIGGNGFLAIYLSAVVLGNSNFIHRRSIIRFFEGQAWLMQIILFLTLGLLVFPSQMLSVAGWGLLIAIFLMLVARPVGVFASLVFFRMNIRSKLFISWVGLRGAVPIVFATYPMLAGLEKSNAIFNLVFFISVSSVLLQGTTLSYIAKLLGVALPPSVKRRDLPGVGDFDKVKSEMEEVFIEDGSKVTNRKIVDLNIPYTVHIMAIKRGETFLQPIGSTKILAGDQVYLLADNKNELEKAFEILDVKSRL